ncbi:DUF4238 domain-containing protein [Kitasatospora purpeofusca]|uniref:DUF4238 domain-containing protein n=1 Tax=Kitasatospora purpeofusca TaxID=67352 RepID=UPI0037F8FA35
MQQSSPDAQAQARRQRDRIEELRAETDRPVVRQHVVSEVLLKRFAVPHGSQGHVLHPFDLEHPERHPKRTGLRGCGRVDDFVPFASASLEKLWHQVENRLPAAAHAAERGDVFDHDQHVLVLKDFIALHLVRSLRYRALHEQILRESIARLRLKLVTDWTQELRAQMLRRTGLHAAGPGGLLATADDLIEAHLDIYRNGADLRIRIEDMFEKAKTVIRAARLQVATPEAGEFILGDVPAMTIRQDRGRMTYGMALGDSTAVVLPLGPRLLLVGRSPRDEAITLDAPTVQALNGLQIEAAHRYIYLRPRSGTERFVRDYLAAGGRHR